jgi:hypothetical protein
METQPINRPLRMTAPLVLPREDASSGSRASRALTWKRRDEGDVSELNMIAPRFRPGAISESSSSHLPPSEASKLANPVTECPKFCVSSFCDGDFPFWLHRE